MEYKKLLAALKENEMKEWASLLSAQLFEYFSNLNHGNYSRWKLAVDNLPTISDITFVFNSDSIVVGLKSECTNEQQLLIKKQLVELMPWRKGPFNLFGIEIDTEWRSNWKWDRLKDQIKSLKNKIVLDIGCGNGYYDWRMLDEKAKYIVGMDSSLLFFMQYLAIKKYLPDANLDILPFGIQTLSKIPLNFDTVFSMGVIYHRRDPINHLRQLMNCLKLGGELVLETLIIDSNKPEVLSPKGRYAKMNNVWAIPSYRLLIEWIEKVGFNNARIINVTKTTTEEQRKTDWMKFESLADFLDKKDNSKTIEGYPAPTRAILLAEKP